MIKKLFVVLITLLSVNTFSQKSKVFLEHVGRSNGLIAQTIYEIFPASNGHLWLSTDIGVLRYNGSNFEHFTTSNGLADMENFGVFEDDENLIWFRSLNGRISRSNYHDISTYSVLAAIQKQDFNSYVSGICQIGNTMYFTSYHGRIISYNKLTNKIRDRQFEGLINGVYCYNDQLVVVTSEGYRILDPDSLELKEEFSEFKSIRVVRSVLLNDELWLSNNGILLRCDLESNNCQEVYRFQDEIISLSIIDSVLWVGTRDGVYQLNRREKLKPTEVLLRGYEVTSICRDFEGGTWFSTLENGLFYKAPGTIVVLNSSISSPLKNRVSELYSDKQGRLWVGYGNSAYTFMDTSQNSNHISIGEDKFGNLKQIRNYNDMVYMMDGLRIYTSSVLTDKEKGMYLAFPANDLVIDMNGDFLLGGNNLWKGDSVTFNKNLGNINTQRPSNGEFAVLLEERVNTFLKDKNNDIWIGTVNGLYRYHGDSVERINVQDGLVGSIYDIQVGSGNDLILTSYTKGIFIGNIQDGWRSISNSSTQHCLKSIFINDTLWVQTIKGISWSTINDSNQFPPLKEASFLTYVNGHEVTDIEAWMGKLVFSLDSSVLMLSDHKSNNIGPLIFLSAVISDQNSLENNASLNPESNNITFRYAGVSYLSSNSLTYEYKLEGFEEKWFKTDAKSLTFESLNPGNYIFKIKACSGDNCGETKSFEFSVKRSALQHPLFILFCIILLVVLTYLIVQVYLKKMKKRHLAETMQLKLQNEIKEIEQQALRLQMNPHFIFNALNTIKGFYSTKDIESANHYISKFSRLLRIILEHKESNISLSLEIEHLNLYLDLIKLRYNSNFETVFNTNGLNTEKVQLPTLLIQPFVENSVIHGISSKIDQGKIEVTFKKENQYLICTIKDNGVGRNNQSKENNLMKKNRVNSIQIVKRRLEIIQDEYKTETSILIKDLKEGEKVDGTEVIIKIPYIETW